MKTNLCNQVNTSASPFQFNYDEWLGSFCWTFEMLNDFLCQKSINVCFAKCFYEKNRRSHGFAIILIFSDVVYKYIF